MDRLVVPSPLCVTDLRVFWPGARRPILDIPSLSLSPRERLLLRGPSGSGKSTLLFAIAGAVGVSSGTIAVCGRDVASLRGAARDRFRAEHVGIVYQLFNLIPYLSALENVTLACKLSRRRRLAAGDPSAEAHRLLAAMGLTDPRLLASPASTLSVGQQQRVAAARALIGRPQLILADEPTSALDPAARDAFLDLLLSECTAAGAALLCVSHDPALAPHFDRTLDLATLNRAEDAERC